jgi:hypothetical protein
MCWSNRRSHELFDPGSPEAKYKAGDKAVFTPYVHPTSLLDRTDAPLQDRSAVPSFLLEGV